MSSDAAEEGGEEEERLRKFKKGQMHHDNYASATKANAVMKSGGYDHLEGPDFDNVHKAISEQYERKADEKTVRYSVHGTVQGVGYRWFVRNIAKKNGIRGIVRNVSDGSVEIIAVGDEASLLRFEKEIQVSEKSGPQVMHLERTEQKEHSKPEYEDFSVEKDKE
jgi:acylphosphatase